MCWPSVGAGRRKAQPSTMRTGGPAWSHPPGLGVLDVDEEAPGGEVLVVEEVDGVVERGHRPTVGLCRLHGGLAGAGQRPAVHRPGGHLGELGVDHPGGVGVAGAQLGVADGGEHAGDPRRHARQEHVAVLGGVDAHRHGTDALALARGALRPV